MGTLDTSASARARLDLDGPLPSEQGFLGWTIDPATIGGVTSQSSASVAGRITLRRVEIRRQTPINEVWFALAGFDAAASLSNCYVGTYDMTGARRSVSADISTLLMSDSEGKPAAQTSQATFTPGFALIAMLLGAGSTWTTNGLTFKCTGAGVSANANLSAPSLRFGSILTGQTSLPTQLTLANMTSTSITGGWGSQWYGWR